MLKESKNWMLVEKEDIQEAMKAIKPNTKVSRQIRSQLEEIVQNVNFREKSLVVYPVRMPEERKKAQKEI